MNKKKSKTHYQRGEYKVVEELTLDRQERRVEESKKRLVRRQNAEEGSRDARMREDEEEKGTNEGR